MMDHPVVKKLLQIEIVADEMLDEVARAARRRGRFAGYALSRPEKMTTWRGSLSTAERETRRRLSFRQLAPLGKF